MSDEREQAKPELTHVIENYGCTIRHSFYNEYAVLIDPDGHEQPFEENRGMIAQGAPSATLLAIHAAKHDQQVREHRKAEERQEAAKARAAKLVADKAPPPIQTPQEPDEPVVVDSPVLPKPAPSTPPPRKTKP